MWKCIVGLVVLVTYGNCQQHAQISDPCSRRSRVSEHDTHCDKYYQCFEGNAVEVDCPNGLVFSGKGHGQVSPCDYDHNVDCSDRPNRNPPISTEHCDWLYGIFGHESSCTRYWTCWNGTAVEQFCIGGLLYNEEAHACDWPENVEGCQKHPLCKDDPYANVPLGKSCNRYWQCHAGYPRLQRCPAMLVFDKRSLRCVAPPTEDCDIPTTQAPPPEDEDQRGQGQGGQGNQFRGQQQQGQRGQQQGQRGRPQINLGPGPQGLPIGAVPVNFQDFQGQQG